MKVNPHTGGGGCGGDDTTVQIQIGSSCNTTAKLYPTGTTVHWTAKDDLKNCPGDVIYDPTGLNKPVGIKILPTDKNKDYCIDEVEVVLEHQNSEVYYVKKTDDKWRQGDLSLSLPREF